MILKQARDYYQLGVITFLNIDKVGSGWVLVVDLKNGTSSTIQTVRNKEKIYKTLDALYIDVQTITGTSPSIIIDFYRFII